MNEELSVPSVTKENWHNDDNYEHAMGSSFDEEEILKWKSFPNDLYKNYM